MVGLIASQSWSRWWDRIVVGTWCWSIIWRSSLIINSFHFCFSSIMMMMVVSYSSTILSITTTSTGSLSITTTSTGSRRVMIVVSICWCSWMMHRIMKVTWWLIHLVSLSSVSSSITLRRGWRSNTLTCLTTSSSCTRVRVLMNSSSRWWMIVSVMIPTWLRIVILIGMCYRDRRWRIVITTSCGNGSRSCCTISFITFLRFIGYYRLPVTITAMIVGWWSWCCVIRLIFVWRFWSTASLVRRGLASASWTWRRQSEDENELKFILTWCRSFLTIIWIIIVTSRSTRATITAIVSWWWSSPLVSRSWSIRFFRTSWSVSTSSSSPRWTSTTRRAIILSFLFTCMRWWGGWSWSTCLSMRSASWCVWWCTMLIKSTVTTERWVWILLSHNLGKFCLSQHRHLLTVIHWSWSWFVDTFVPENAFRGKRWEKEKSERERVNEDDETVARWKPWEWWNWRRGHEEEWSHQEDWQHYLFIQFASSAIGMMTVRQKDGERDRKKR